MKLDNKYQQARSNILMLKEAPTISEAYEILLQEQTHQEINKGVQPSTGEEGIACRVDKRKYSDSKTKSSNKKINTNFYCENCKILGHTLDRSWKVLGYSQIFKSNTWRKEI